MKIIKFPIDEFLLRNTGMALDSLRSAGVPVAGKTELQGVESGRLVCYTERGFRVFEYHPDDPPPIKITSSVEAVEAVITLDEFFK